MTPDPTDAEIEALSETARRAEDWPIVALCQRALNLLSINPPHGPDPYRIAVAQARTRSMPDARRECARILTARQG